MRKKHFIVGSGDYGSTPAGAERGEARAGLQSARAAIDRAALDLEFTRVTAPPFHAPQDIVI